MFRDMTELNWIFLNSRVKNESNHPPLPKQQRTILPQRVLTSKCIPEQGHKCTHEVKVCRSAADWEPCWRTPSPSGHPSNPAVRASHSRSLQVPEMIWAVQMSQGSCKPWAWPQPLSAPLFSCHSWLGHWPNHGLLWRASQTRPTFPYDQTPDVPAIALYCWTGSNNLSEVTFFTVLFFLILFSVVIKHQ